MGEATAAHTATEAQMDAANQRLNALAGQLNMAHAALTAEVAELLGNDGWRQGAVRSPSGFL